MASFQEYLQGNTASKTTTKPPAKTGSFSQFLNSQSSAPAKPTSKPFEPPVGGKQIGENKWVTPSGSIWEYSSDGTRTVTLANQFGGGAYSIDPNNPNKIINQGHTTYGGVQAEPGMNRDDIVPVSLGGVNQKKENIKLVPASQNPADLETELANRVKRGELTLAQARLIISEFKQNGYKTPTTSTVKNFISSIPGALKEIGKTALELPKSLVEPFTNPSPTEQAIEQKIVPEPNSKAQKILTAIPRAIAKGFVRAAEPMVEGLGQEIGTFASDPRNPENLPQDSFQSFLHAANVGVAIGGSVKILTEELGTNLANTSETLRITPDELRTKLINDEIQHPKAQALARELITNNQTLEVTGTKPAEGVRGKVGKAIGGVEKAPEPQFRIIDNGEPVAGELPSEMTNTELAKRALNPNPRGRIDVNARTPLDGPAKTYPRYVPINEEPLQTPEIKTSKLAQGVEEKAVASKLTEGFQGLPEYAKVNVADQARAASNLLTVNREQAINIAMGHELPPEGILPESVFVAVENHAIQTGDVALLRDLATSSNLPTEATGMGQRLRMLAERDPNSAVSAIQKVVKIKEAAASKKYGNVSKAKQKIKNDIQNEIKKTTPKAKDWSGFLDELKCA